MNSFIDPHCVSVYIVHKNGDDSKYLLIRRCGKYLNNTWQMITGGIDKGEKAWEAALREIKEETGLIPDKLYSADAVETFYMITKDKIAFVPVFVAFVNSLTEIQLSPTEHDAYQWLSFGEAIDKLIWSEQKRILALVHNNFVLKEPLKTLFII